MTTEPQPSASFPEKPFSQAVPWVALVSFMFLITYLARAMFGPLLPYIEEEYGITHAASTRLLLYMSLGYSLSMCVSGYTVSKIRPRLMVSVSVILCGVIMLVMAYTKELMPLTLLFILLGVAAGQYFNGGISTMRSLVRPKQWSRAISIHEFGPNGSFIFGPIIAGIGALYVGWRGTVIIMGCIALVGGILFTFLAKGGDDRSAPLSFKGIGKAVKEPQLWLFTWLMGLAVAGEFAPYSVLSLHMVNDRSLSPEKASYLLALCRLAAPFAVLGGGYITMILGTKKTLVMCLIGYAIGMFLLALPSELALIAGMVLQPAFTAMTLPPIFNMLAESFPLKDQSMLLSIGVPLGSFFGVGVMSYVLGLWGDYATFSGGFIMLGCMVALTIPLLFLIPKRSQAEAL